MATRGAPRKNGVKSGDDLLRATVVLEAFRVARESGLKFELALLAAIDAAKAAFPTMRTGVTTVKRILAECVPKDGEEMMVAKKIVTANVVQNEMDRQSIFQPKSRTTYAVGFAPRAHYPRANAVKRAQKS
jgi:hypothetical protein